jgi:hypothetical protein
MRAAQIVLRERPAMNSPHMQSVARGVVSGLSSNEVKGWAHNTLSRRPQRMPSGVLERNENREVNGRKDVRYHQQKLRLQIWR